MRRRRSPLRRLLRGVVVLVVVLGVLAAGAVGIGWLVTPSVTDAPQRVAAALAAAHAPALQGAVPEKVADALIATEDSRFRSNPGVDPISLLRAPYSLVTGRDQGGATLEQQLAKNLYVGGRTGGLATPEAGVLALKLDRAFTKDEILRLYLDDGYYGHGYTGLTAASEGYFGVPPDALSWAQAALLAGLFQAPSADDPLAHPAAARARQHHVLDRLVTVGTLTRAQADAAAAAPWGLREQG